MSAAVMARDIHDRRRAVLGYGIGLGLMIVWVMAVYPSVETELVDYIDAMPEAMKSIFGIDDITSLAGFVHAETFTFMGPIVFLALAITTGANTISGEERDRILPVVLATGLGRRRLLLSKLGALAVELAALSTITLGALIVGLLPAGGGIGIVGATSAVLRLGLLGLLFGTLALAVGAATGSKARATGAATGVAFATYLIDALSNLVSWLQPVEFLSPFHWYAPGNPLVGGLSPGGLVLLAAAIGVLAAAGAAGFQRRDIGV